VTKYAEIRRPNGTRHPLAGVSQTVLDAAHRGARQTFDVFDSDEDREHAVEAILIALRAGGHLNGAALFVARADAYEAHLLGYGYGDPVTGQVIDLHDWPYSENITGALFGVTSVPWDQAVWAANNLNTDYAVTPQAWAAHQEKIKEGGS
jgi:hypothetical protein